MSEENATLQTQQWMSIKDIVALTRLSRGTIYNEMNAGRLASFQVGKCRRFLPDDVASWQARYIDPAAKQQ